MAESTGIKSIDQLVKRLETLSGIELKRNIYSKERKTVPHTWEYAYELFIYQSGQDTKQYFGISHLKNTVTSKEQTELHLLKLKPDNNLIKHYVDSVEKSVKYVRVPGLQSIGVAEEMWNKGQKYGALELAAENKAGIEIVFKDRQTKIDLMTGSSFPPPHFPKKEGLLTLTGDKSFNYSEKEFLKYIMTANPR